MRGCRQKQEATTRGQSNFDFLKGQREPFSVRALEEPGDLFTKCLSSFERKTVYRVTIDSDDSLPPLLLGKQFAQVSRLVF